MSHLEHNINLIPSPSSSNVSYGRENQEPVEYEMEEQTYGVMGSSQCVFPGDSDVHARGALASEWITLPCYCRDASAGRWPAALDSLRISSVARPDPGSPGFLCSTHPNSSTSRQRDGTPGPRSSIHPQATHWRSGSWNSSIAGEQRSEHSNQPRPNIWHRIISKEPSTTARRMPS